MPLNICNLLYAYAYPNSVFLDRKTNFLCFSQAQTHKKLKIAFHFSKHPFSASLCSLSINLLKTRILWVVLLYKSPGLTTSLDNGPGQWSNVNSKSDAAAWWFGMRVKSSTNIDQIEKTFIFLHSPTEIFLPWWLQIPANTERNMRRMNVRVTNKTTAILYLLPWPYSRHSINFLLLHALINDVTRCPKLSLNYFFISLHNQTILNLYFYNLIRT